MIRYFERLKSMLSRREQPALDGPVLAAMPTAFSTFIFSAQQMLQLHNSVATLTANENVAPTYEGAFSFDTVLDTKIYARLTEAADSLVTQISKAFTGHDMPIDRSGRRNLITDVFELVSLVRGAKSNAPNLSDWLAKNHRSTLMIIAGRLALTKSIVCQNAAAGLMEILAESPKAPAIIRLHRDAYATRITTGPSG